MSIQLPSLPYAADALEPHISARTLQMHYDKHHRSYVNKLNHLLVGTDFAHSSLETIISAHAQESRIAKDAAAIYNNAAQAWNHAFYWNSLRPPGGRAPVEALAAQIAKTFGSLGGCAQALLSTATDHFGSGWAWLVTAGDALEVISTADADTPIVHGLTPLLVIDFWEHAYCLDRQERRSSYVAAVIDNLLDWEFAEANFARANGSRGAHPCTPLQRAAAPLHA